MESNNSVAIILPFTTSAVIDAYHNEAVLWDTIRNAGEEKKELAWLRLAGLFGQSTGNRFVSNYDIQNTVFPS
jgi:hypothetical protein